MTFKLIKKTILVLVLLVLAGAGCDAVPQDNETSSTSTSIKVSDPELTLDQMAYLFCQDQGYRINISYDERYINGLISCIFDDGNSCPAVNFLDGSCGPQHKPASQDIAFTGFKDPSIPRFCEQVSAPVCGANGKTYANECIAQQEEVDVVNQGPCGGPQATVELPDEPEKVGVESSKSPSTGSSRTTRTVNVRSSQTKAVSVPDNHPMWIDTLIGLLKTDLTPGTAVEYCKVGTKSMYLQTGSLSTLYKENGLVSCYPSKDDKELCPDEFWSSRSSCSVIWRK